MNLSFRILLCSFALVSVNSWAAPMTKAEYKTAKERIQQHYKAEHKTCKTSTSQAKDACK